MLNNKINWDKFLNLIKTGLFDKFNIKNSGFIDFSFKTPGSFKFNIENKNFNIIK